MDQNVEFQFTTQDKIVIAMVGVAVVYAGYSIGKLAEDWAVAGYRHFKNKKTQTA